MSPGLSPAEIEDPSLVVEGAYWRKARAGRVAFLVDSAAYFAAALSAIRKARRSILLLGWSFDPRARLQPGPHEVAGAADEIGNVLKSLAERRPELDVRVLIWKSALPISASQDFFPHRARPWFRGSPVRFRLDSSVPYGACHHQKVLVVDDLVAFCGGADFAPDRWDTPAHLDEDPRRIMPGGGHPPARHEVMMMLDGEAARCLGELARRRWLRSAGHAVAAPPEDLDHDPWPNWLPPDLENAEVALSRTEPAWRGQHEVNEIERLHLSCIRAAKRSIYLENQYFTSPVIGEALAARLAEPDGPEIVLVSTEHSPSYFDQMTMDRTRSDLLRRLWAADFHGRFRAYFPRTRAGETVLVHSKTTIIDDRLARIGSANLNNRSSGFDTECDAAVEARTAADQAAIARFRARLLGHFAGAAPADVEVMIAERGLAGAADELARSSAGRLSPMAPAPMGPLASLIAAYHLGDPLDASDSWRPLLRRRRLEGEAEGATAPPPPLPPRLDPEVDQ
jgi:phosphatidylserine/phosphatidylglycerophosphate/cardiolipin synthase-like enzyme